MSAASSDFAKPDFAFPRKVADNSLAQLRSATRTGDDRLAIRALINYTIAQGTISRDSVDTGLALADSLLHRMHSPASAAMVNMLLAQFYTQIYESNRWKYDNRQLPLQPLPGDYRQWSGDQFRMKVGQLVDSALTDKAALQATPLSAYDGVVKIPAGAESSYPTVFDFIMLRATEILQEMSAEQPLFPAAFLCGAKEFESLDFSYQPESARRQLELMRDWLAARGTGTAAFVAADIVRLDYVSARLSSAGNNTDSLRFAAYVKLYKSCASIPEAGNALHKAAGCINYDNLAVMTQLLNLTDGFLKQHPRSHQAKCLKNVRDRIVQPRINVEYGQTLVPGSSLKVAVKGFNAAGYQLRLYRIEASNRNSGYYAARNSERQPTLVSTTGGKGAHGKMPYAVIDTVTIPIEHAGWYIVVPVTSVTEKSDFKNKSYPVVYCTGLMLENATFSPDRWTLVVNPLTGRPVADATVRKYSNKGVLLETYKTDNSGTVAQGNTSGTLRAQLGDDKYAAPLYNSQVYVHDKATRYRLQAFTDRALYRQSDTVRWCAVADAFTMGKNTVLPGCELTAVLRDANYQPVDTAKAVTDKFGRVEGAFVLPSSRLTGNFTIQLTAQRGQKTLTRGNASFMVSDYKLPTFRIDSLKAIVDTPDKGCVRLTGRAVTYAGFPLDGCSIKLNLSVAERQLGWWWNRGSQISFYTAEAAAGPDGRFTIDLPSELLRQSPVPGGVFTADADATSASGETQNASTRFVLGYPCMIEAQWPDNINITGGRIPVTASLTDCNGDIREGRLNLKITDKASKTVLDTELNSGKEICVDVKGIPSGSYTFEIAPVDSTIARPVQLTGRILYRDNDTVCPDADATLWTPQTTIKLAPGKRTTEIILGSNAEKSFIHYALTTDSTLVSQGWTTAGQTLHRFPVTLPDGADRMTVSLWTVNNYREASANITIEAEPQPGIAMQIESFRDRITPGQQEKWTFRITDSEGRGRQAALMLDMYNHALDQLMKHSFSLAGPFSSITSYNINGTYSTGNISDYAQKDFRYINCNQIQPPFFQIWGMSLAGKGRQYAYRAMGSVFTTGSVKNEAKMMAYDTVEEAAPVAMADMGASMDAETVEDAENETEAREPEIPVDQLRQAEMPLAFFRPMLTTDADGLLTFSFTAPNANATWRLCAQAFTADMLSAYTQRDIISAKPVMVQPNLPRFLRIGDRAVMKALVMNNTDSTACTTTRIEIFNPLTNKVISTHAQTDTIVGMQSATVAVTVDTPADMPALGYRVYTTQGTYTDGEQAMIPVLEASSAVVETTPFYMAPGQKQFSMQLPDAPADARITLQFCQNPTWYVVTALPGLRKGNPNDALSAGAAIFSAATARGLMRTNPAIAEAIKEWSRSDRSDSTLISMLQRNADLKTVLLECTPWVSDAQSDTERMARLAMLFDDSTVDSAIKNAIDKLEKLDCAGGGWRWIEQSTEPSEWVTENLLFIFGRLNRMGFMPDDERLARMQRNAVAFIDAEMNKQIKRDPKTTDVAFTYLRQIYYPSVRLTGKLQDMALRTVKRLADSWKGSSAPYKALAAVLLQHNGYKAQAAKAMESIGEFAVSDPTKGMWWPSVEETGQLWWSPSAVARTCIILDAYALLKPESPAIDLIRQWVILQKEAENWGNSVATTSAITSLLTTGTNWTRPQQPAVIKIGRKKLAQSPTDIRLGYVRANISDMSPSGKKLSIDNPGDSPAWGAVYRQFTAPMQDIAPASCPDLSIEKKLFRRVETPQGAVWEETDSFNIGDIVQVNLVITAGRNMDYVAIIDQRAACFEPSEQLPRPLWAEGICFYRENRDSSTDIFVDRLPKGTYRLSYTLTVNNAGRFASGIASAQSQYAPELSAHSSGTQLTVK